MKKTILSLFITALVLIFGCSTTRVETSQISKDVFTENFQTFNFYDLSAETDIPEEIDLEKVKLLKDAIATQLRQAGLQVAPDPDLWVNIGIAVEDKVQTRQTDIRDAPIYIGQRRYNWESEEIVLDEYRVGAVSIDFVDASSGNMIAQAFAQGVIPENEQKLKKKINKSISEVFASLWRED